jgi:hypothetical protein
MNRFLPSDEIDSFLRDNGAASFDSNGRPVGSTGGMVSLNEEQERRLGRLRGGQQGQPTNPLAKLNEVLGLRIGEPYMGSAVRQVADSLPAGQQMAGALKDQSEAHKAAEVARMLQERGGLPHPGHQDFNTQRKVAEAVFNKVYSPAPSSSFLPKPVYMGGGLAPTGEEVLSENGGLVTGYGGTQISGTRGVNGGPNRFLLSQNPDTVPAGNSFFPKPASAPSAAAMKFLEDGIDPQVLESAERGTPFQQAASQYEAAVNTALYPREANKPEYRDGNVYEVKGRQALLKGGRFIDTETGAPLYSRNAFGEDIPNPLVFGENEQTAAPAGKKPGPAFTKGQRVKQGGVMFEFDGVKMVPVQG